MDRGEAYVVLVRTANQILHRKHKSEPDFERAESMLIGADAIEELDGCRPVEEWVTNIHPDTHELKKRLVQRFFT
jgi:hypothetical protein